MIKELAGIAKVLTSAVAKIKQHRKDSDRRDDNIQLIKILFLLKDLEEDGRKLLEQTPSGPLNFVQGAKAEVISERLKTWDVVLRRQGLRLQEVQRFLSTRPDFDAICPREKKLIMGIVGRKTDRVFSLHALGAGLFFRTVLPMDETPEGVAELVAHTLTLRGGVQFDSATIAAELGELADALESYRKALFEFVSVEEARALSAIARAETLPT